MPALQARRLRRALLLQVHVAHGEEIVGGGTRHQVHENREVARLRQSSLAAVAHAHRASSLVADPSKDPARGTSRAMKLPLVRVVTGGRPRQGPGLRLDQNIKQRCCTKRELGRKRKNWAPDATWTRPGTQNFHRSQVVQCAWNQAGNPTTRRAEPIVSQAAKHQGICPVATFVPRDHRTSHTRRRALTPPCLPARDQQFCGPQSRQAGIAALRRALWRLLRLGTFHASRAQDAGRARKCALWRCRQKCALVSRWSGAPAVAWTRVPLARAFSQSLDHAQATRSSQCPDAVSLNQRAQSSERCV